MPDPTASAAKPEHSDNCVSWHGWPNKCDCGAGAFASEPPLLLSPERDAEISERMAELAVTNGEPRFVWTKRLHAVHLSIEATVPRWEKCALCFAQARAVVEGLDR